MSGRISRLRADLIGSIPVAALEVPQAMAYALLAGLAPVTGLWASVAAPLGQALLGRDRHLSVGPMALVCLLVAGGLHGMAEPASARYAELATVLALEVGVLLALFGLLRAGFLSNFLGHPATVGFNAAAALLTGASQVPSLAGLGRGATGGPENPWPVLLHLNQAQALPLSFGVATLAILVLLPRFVPRIPGALVACVVGGAVTAALGLNDGRLATVGELPATWPTLRFPAASWNDLRALFPAALSIAVVAYGGSIAMAKTFAARERERVQPDRVLLGLGGANVASALVGGFAVSASLSRSRLMAQVGVRSRLAPLFVAGWVLLAMVAFSPAFRVLPLAVLAAIIIHGVAGLVDPAQARAIWRAHRRDAATMALTFAATLSLGLVKGLAVGLGIALVFFVVRTAVPHTAELGRMPGSLVYRNSQRYAVEICPQIGILRIDAPLMFANARFLEDRIHQLFAERPGLKLVALDCSGMNDLDATGVQALCNVVDALRARGCDLHLIGPIGPVRDVLTRTGLAQRLSEANLHRTILEAAPAWLPRISREHCTRQCRVSAFPDCEAIPRAGE